MAHNAYIHGGQADPTAWLPGYEVLQLDFQKIDDYLFQSINGDLGGTWSPASRIVLGGVGLEVTTAFLVTGLGQANFYSGSVVIDSSAGVTFAGISVIFDPSTAVTFQNGLDTDPGTLSSIRGSLSVGTVDTDLLAVFATTVFNEDASTAVGVKFTFNDQTEFNGQNQFDDATVFNGFTTFTAQVQFDATVAMTFASGSTITGATDANLDFDGTSAVSFGATSTLAFTAGSEVLLDGVIVPGGTGHVRKRPAITLPNLDSTFGIADGDNFLAGALTANRTYKLTTTGASNGDVLQLANFSVTWTINLVDDGSSPIINLKQVSGSDDFVELQMVGGSWQIIDIGHVP